MMGAKFPLVAAVVLEAFFEVVEGKSKSLDTYY